MSGNVGALLIDLMTNAETNRLSLAKAQALAWTIVLVISYTYYVIMVFLILDNSVIPDFDSSLLILLGISTGGMLVARGQDRNMGATEYTKRADKPRVSDLLMEGGAVSLARLQLVAFTIVALGIFIVYMTSPDIVSTGLPTMPTTLLALMGVSQGGYLASKTVEPGEAEIENTATETPPVNTTPPTETPSLENPPVQNPPVENPPMNNPPAAEVPPVQSPLVTNPPAAEDPPAVETPPTAENPPAAENPQLQKPHRLLKIQQLRILRHK